MSIFDSTKTELSTLLNEIVQGKLQLPDFQRGWVWDDEHIRSLLVSIARSFPIGAVMLLETGGPAKFQARPVAGVTPARNTSPEKLILDGQQRLTSLTQVLKSSAPVATRDEKKRPVQRHYYFDIKKALAGPDSLEEALVGLDETRQKRSNFGKQVDLDLSSRELEFEQFHFPLSQVLNSNEWEMGLYKHQPANFPAFMTFRDNVLEPIRKYSLPVIQLKKENSKAAVCLVFEKVNTGGVPLDVFELVTATYAADGFNLRRAWYGEGTHKGLVDALKSRPLLSQVEPTDFLQGLSLLNTFGQQEADLASGKNGKDVRTVSAKREHILDMPLSAFKAWSEPLVKGFLEAEKFLRKQGFYEGKFLPYRPQLVPLAAVLAKIGDKWLEHQTQDRLARWFWCGVLGELYGSATETRIALDLQQLLDWVLNDGALPKTILDASFHANRLDTLRTRTSAAYRGLYVLLQREGAKDFFWKTTIKDLEKDYLKEIDIHHIFPRDWCDKHGIPRSRYDSIVNKTAISARGNRKIGGDAPSKYLAKLQTDKAVQLDDVAMNAILGSHLIDAKLLRADDFDAFYAARRSALLGLVEQTMGKVSLASSPTPEEPTDEGDAEAIDESGEP